MTFERQVALPIEIKELYPMDAFCTRVFEERDGEIKRVLSGKDDRLLLIIGPCSADNEQSVMDYVTRLVKVQEKVKNEVLIVPRIYTNKPRTTGDGYKGMLHQPDPSGKPDMMKGLIAIRELHIRAIRETGFTCA
ncbi:MAG TPA: 3-deoxy-7-phosphoheptulonate synthase, partial [Clostridiales bacterium]|nr:3-deoxy-7-phosphoheptulonate synthase [Clostridiales bacterium]